MTLTGQTGKWLLLFAIFVMLATARHSYAGEYPCSGSPDTDLENIKRARAKAQGEFVRLDRYTLKFEGPIVRGTYGKYLAAIDDKVKTLIVNSSGGDSYDGVRIGLDLAQRTIDVIVDGVAGSSAANYLFTAGRHKTICRGFVGFNGNAGASNDKKSLEESIRSAAAKTGVGREQIEKALQEARATTEATQKLEKEFLTRLGISQKLFDMTQRDAKGLSPELNLNFEFLLPSLRTMEQFGIRNVEGRQDIELAERLGLQVIYY
jgi:hypothetical protein